MMMRVALHLKYGIQPRDFDALHLCIVKKISKKLDLDAELNYEKWNVRIL